MRGGIKLNHKNKELTHLKDIEKMPAPSVVFIPLGQHIGAEAEAVVKKGNEVKIGTLIGKKNGDISANVHSSISGKVMAIEKRENEEGKKVTVVKIKNDGLNKEQKLRKLTAVNPASIIRRVEEAGIVGMGGAGFPTHVKLNVKPGTIDTVILNGSECEDYLTCDDLVMKTYPQEVVEGGILIAKATGAKTVVVAIEDNKIEAYTQIAKYIKKLAEQEIRVYANLIKAKYPNGAEKLLVKEVTGRVVPEGKLSMNVGVLVNNIQTARAVYNAVVNNMVSTTRIVTVSGRAIKNPGNYEIPAGTPISYILDYVKEKSQIKEVVKFEDQATKNYEHAFELYEMYKEEKVKKSQLVEQYKQEYKAQLKKAKRYVTENFNFVYAMYRSCLAKVVIGGSMCGTSAKTLDAVTSKRMGGILFLSMEENSTFSASSCINCGRCIKACPVGLMPNKLNKYFVDGNLDMCLRYKLNTCINCGCCSFVCPAKLELTENFKMAKLLAKNQKGGR